MDEHAAVMPGGPVWRAVCALALVCAASGVSAQQPGAPVPAPATRPMASLFGTIGDSLRGGPLAGATVTVLGTTRSGRTNLRGIFVIDSIPVGSYQVRIEHPFLDSLALAIVSPPVELGAGQRVEVSASTPTVREFRVQNCARSAAVTAGPTILFGRVIDADTDGPLENAVLSFVYRDANGGATTPERVRQARTNAKGVFTVCGLPEALTGSLQVSYGTGGKAEIQVKHSGLSDIAAVRFVVGAGPAVAVARGRVIARSGAPLAGAEVSVLGTSRLTTTDADGRFVLEGLPGGTQMLQVRKVGYAAFTMPVELSARRPQELSVAMADAAQALAAVKVVGEYDEGLARVGFTERQRLTNGSRFMTPKEIEDLHPILTTDLLRQLPGFRVSGDISGRTIESTRSVAGTTAGCVNIFVDRALFEQYAAGDLDRAIPAKIVTAIEVYTSTNSIPTEFTVNARVCPTIAIWTKTKLMKP